MPVDTPAGSLVQQRAASTFFAPIQREFDRLFDQLGAGWASFSEQHLAPRMDIRETESSVEITAELPGMAEKDVKIALSDNLLTISGEKTAETETRQQDYRLSERSYGAFSRTIALPPGVDADKIKATMRDGVLKLTAPKSPTSQAKTIPIETAH
jgi:HSP20 family protein